MLLIRFAAVFVNMNILCRFSDSHINILLAHSAYINDMNLNSSYIEKDVCKIVNASFIKGKEAPVFVVYNPIRVSPYIDECLAG